MKLDVKAFALAGGIVSWIVSLLMALFVVFSGQGSRYFEMIAAFHPGYSPTVLGAVIASIWMLIYGLIVGALFAYVYNHFAK
ncbi:MAG: hypothetical protein LUQ38_06640 [Methanotrichaceae archaeon]|nr:hypothetical protein [Methanotrichaceae archaeon]MDD1758022.1 hypothetical protein [Methanotrichaceae archaeon]